jgi:hypothetical protein
MMVKLFGGFIYTIVVIIVDNPRMREENKQNRYAIHAQCDLQMGDSNIELRLCFRPNLVHHFKGRSVDGYASPVLYRESEQDTSGRCESPKPQT